MPACQSHEGGCFPGLMWISGLCDFRLWEVLRGFECFYVNVEVICLCFLVGVSVTVRFFGCFV